MCPIRPRDFWSIARAIWQNHGADLPLTLRLVAWAEINHPDAFAYLTRSIHRPDEIRKTLGAIGRRWRDADAANPPALIEREPGDPSPPFDPSWSAAIAEHADELALLRPYVERTADENADRALDKAWRGVRDKSDRAAVDAVAELNGLTAPTGAYVEIAPAPGA